jgi:RHS repeat-associated protein
MKTTDDGTAAFTYNVFNQQTQYSMGPVTAQYVYNADGIRTSKTINGQRTTFLLDGGNVAAEVQDGQVTATYLRGINLISQDVGYDRFYYQYNAHGDVVTLTDQTGSVSKSYDYTAFGIESDPDADDENPFRYCGEYFDSETGTYYLRARYYASIGRFTQPDSHWNNANRIYGDNPQKINERQDALGTTLYSYRPQISAIMQSGNLYAYALNNPISYSDPTGGFVVTTAMLISAGCILVFGTAGGIIGGKIADRNGVTGWKRTLCVAGGTLAGSLGGAALASAAVPATTLAGAAAGATATTGAAAATSTASAASQAFLIPEYVRNGGSFISWASQTLEKTKQVLTLDQVKQVFSLAEQYSVQITADLNGHPGTAWEMAHIHLGNLRVHVAVSEESIEWIIQQLAK